RNLPPTDIQVESIRKIEDQVYVLERAKVGTLVGTVRVIDPNPNEEYLYRLIGLAATRSLDLDEKGRITTKIVFRRDLREELPLEIEVEDLGGNVFKRSFTFVVRADTEENSLVLGSRENLGALKVFPNPVRDRLFLRLPVHGDLVIRSVVGGPIYESSHPAGGLELDLSAYPPGVYLLRYVSEEGTRVFPLIKE
ncbi:MAG: T9SS type A sorting domain-containing protein, partial [Cytophagales bacterium]|nr:T9SS type A sorting domain-containing protein [Cytophagales bacterium]